MNAATQRSRGGLHYARLDKSPRLKRLLAYLRTRGDQGATTMEIIVGASVAAVNSAIAELRANGFTINCQPEGATDDGMRIYRYRLAEANEVRVA